MLDTTVAVDGNGQGRVSLHVPAGTYDVRAKNQTHLARRVNGWTYDPSSPGLLDFGTLLAGDCNNDNIVNQSDADYMNSVWGSNDPLADINRDGVVNAFDYALLNSNWNTAGE